MNNVDSPAGPPDIPVVHALDLMLFENDPEQARRALDYGVDCFLIDWEDKGKDERQSGYDTQILPGTPTDLRLIANIPGAKAWCRLNRFGPWTADEVDKALQAGACGIFLPMVTRIEEVERYLEYINGRCSAAILIETLEAVTLTEELSDLPLERIYFGLNDFSISRGDRFLFKAVLDGTVEHVRNRIQDNIQFGFGGVTSIEYGSPVPCIHLIQELARLRCSFSFLRRSFKRDLNRQDPATMVSDIRRFWTRQFLRTPDEIHADREQLLMILTPLCN